MFSYDNSLFWGINADRDLVPDLHDFSTAIEQSYAELRDAAGIKVPDEGVSDIRSAAKAKAKAKSLQGN